MAAGYRQTDESEFVKIYSLEHPPVIRSLEILADTGDSDGLIPAGTVVGKTTATGVFRPVPYTTVSEEVSPASNTIPVASADPFVIGDSVKINSGSALTVTAVNMTLNTLTVTPASTASEDDDVEGQDGSATGYAITVQQVDVEDEADAVPCLMHGIAYRDYIDNITDDLEADLIGRIWFNNAI